MDVSRTFSLSQDNVSGGGTYSYELANLKGNLRMLCVSFVEIETWIRQAEDSPVSFSLETTVTGCKINRGKYPT